MFWHNEWTDSESKEWIFHLYYYPTRKDIRHSHFALVYLYFEECV